VKLVYHIPAQLRTWTENCSRVELEGEPSDVREALELLWARHPGVRDRVVDERGDVRMHVNVFVGEESIRYTGGLATALDHACEISIVPAVSGG
jgi:molybdopterin converting factor small subunit